MEEISGERRNRYIYKIGELGVGHGNEHFKDYMNSEITNTYMCRCPRRIEQLGIEQHSGLA